MVKLSRKFPKTSGDKAVINYFKTLKKENDSSYNKAVEVCVEFCCLSDGEGRVILVNYRVLT